jgi:hypothetical protein
LMQCVYCEVGISFSNIIDKKFVLPMINQNPYDAECI